MCLRPVTAADAPFLHGLANDAMLLEALCDGPTSLDLWEEAIAAWRVDADEADLLILPSPSHHPVGWIAVNGLASADRVAWIKMLALSPAAWGRGYASAALRHTKGWLAAEGYVRLKLWTDAVNARARTCYERNGFTVESTKRTEVGSRKVLRERLRMVCNLEAERFKSAGT